MELPLRSPRPGERRPWFHIETKSVSYEPPSSTKHFQWRHCHAAEGAPRTILRNVTCEALPGELLAIVGPSGAGKTTLLSVLAGVIRPSAVSGCVLVNGRPMDVSQFRRVSGYVAQEDALFPLLTVEESLSYSAKLRLKVPSSAAATRVLELMKELGLDHVASSRVSAHGARGLSGGERRRVSIGVDLVHDPAVLLLDEPTSGLDSASALHIVKILKSMAAIQGKTVVITIHQPGFRILELFDKVVLLSGGTVRHGGSLEHLESRLRNAGRCIPPHVNVLEFAMDAMTSLTDLAPPKEKMQVTSQNSAAEGDGVSYANSNRDEVFLLTSRLFKNVSRTRELFAARLIQSLVTGLGFGSVFMNVASLQTRIGFFAFSLTFLLSSSTEALPLFLQERRIVQREASTGAYRISSYVMANALVFLPLLLAAALLYAMPVYWLLGLRRETDRFLYFAMVVWLVMLMGNSFVACCSALVTNYIMGSSVIAGLIGSFFLFSGYFIAEQSVPKCWAFMNYLSLFKYPFQAMVVNEYGGVRGRGACLEREGGRCALDGSTLLRLHGLHESQRWTSVCVMFGFIFGYRVLCLVILWMRCHGRHRLRR